MSVSTRHFQNFDYRRFPDYVAIAIAISLPWSTSATSILLVVWLLAIFPILNFTDLRKELLTPAGGLPVLLVAWAALGMLWADATWTESFGGFLQFRKLLFIPVLLAYFRKSDFGLPIAKSFIASCVVLFALSVITALWPELQWWQSWGPGVPVKNYVTQSAEFAISAFCLFYLSLDAWKTGARILSITFAIIALALIAFMLLVITSRTELVAIVALVIALCARLFRWKGLLAALTVLAFTTLVAWNGSNYLRMRIDSVESQVQSYLSDAQVTTVGLRLEFWRKSIRFIAEAPVFGHGTGSIGPLFERSAVGKSGLASYVTTNPHNQILAVGVQLGLLGIVILCAMWLAHAWMFLKPGMAAWFGLVIVIQNIMGSLFNTHLFDFTESWIYVGFVGALGATTVIRSNRDH